MSLGREKKRAAAGGYRITVDDGAPLSAGAFRVGPKFGSADIVLGRVRSLLHTWQQFGGGGEDNMIAELHEILGPDDWKAISDG